MCYTNNVLAAAKVKHVVIELIQYDEEEREMRRKKEEGGKKEKGGKKIEFCSAQTCF